MSGETCWGWKTGPILTKESGNQFEISTKFMKQRAFLAKLSTKCVVEILLEVSSRSNQSKTVPNSNISHNSSNS